MSNQLLEEAHLLRRNGNINKALEKYDALIKLNPNNAEYLFGKALCYLETRPIEAIHLFKKVIDLNPSVTPAYGNIIVAANNAREYDEAIYIFDDLVKKNPTNFDFLHKRAILIGNNGDNLKAILDCYTVVESTNLKNNVELFRNHQISTDIAFAKVQLRNSTMQIRISNLSLYDKYEDIDMVEYHYSLPTRLFGDERYFLEFGKYQGFSINEVLIKDPGYLVWSVLNLDNFCLSEEIVYILKNKGLSSKELEEVNIAKIHLLESSKFDESN